MNGRLTALAALLAPVLAASGAMAQDRLATDIAAQVALAPGDTRSFVVEAPAGAYLEGALSVDGAPVDLVLRTMQGDHLRLLESGARGDQTFRFVANGDPLLLSIENVNAQALATLRLTHDIPPEEQGGISLDLQSPRLRTLVQDMAQGAGTAAFWAEMLAHGTPLVEPVPEKPDRRLVTFLYRGAKRNVRLWGGPSNDHDWLDRLGDSDVWFRTYDVPSGLRLTYGLAPDVPQIPGTFLQRRRALLATAQADPLNLTPLPADAPDAFNQVSYLALEDAPDQPGYPPADRIAGTVDTFTFDSPRLGNSRSVSVYRPAGFDPTDPANVLLFVFDGVAFQDDRAPMPGILDTLIGQGRLPPVTAVFIDSVDVDLRSRELTCNPDFAAMLADDLLPEILARTGLPHDPARTAVTGASYGGLAAACAAHWHPDAFGAFLSLSGSFWWQPDAYDGDMPYVSSLFAQGSARPLRAWLSAGIYEAGKGGDTGILGGTRHLRDVMRLKGYDDVFYREYAGGHDYAIWRGSMAEGLIALYGTGP